MIRFQEFINEKATFSGRLKKWEKLFFESAINFLNTKYNTSYNITLSIKKRALKGKSHVFGHINLLDKNNKIVIEDSGTDMMIIYLIHEYIHIKQRNTNAIGISTDKKYITWNRKNYISVVEYNSLSTDDYDKYKELPWEKEAITASEILHNEYFKSSNFKELKGKDPTIDFIIGNRN
jgi:hypothetical protein